MKQFFSMSKVLNMTAAADDFYEDHSLLKWSKHKKTSTLFLDQNMRFHESINQEHANTSPSEKSLFTMKTKLFAH